MCIHEIFVDDTEKNYRGIEGNERKTSGGEWESEIP